MDNLRARVLVPNPTDRVSAEERAEQIASDIWDRPAIETREEFKAAIAAVLQWERQDAELQAVREAARLTCDECRDDRNGEWETLEDWGENGYAHISVDKGASRYCEATSLYRRWPAAASREGTGGGSSEG